jgi:hypothetical protein
MSYAPDPRRRPRVSTQRVPREYPESTQRVPREYGEAPAAALRSQCAPEESTAVSLGGMVGVDECPSGCGASWLGANVRRP